MLEKEILVTMTVNVVIAYVGNNSVEQNELPQLILHIHQALSTLANDDEQTIHRQFGQKPAVPVNKSITSSYIVCLEDGKMFKSLKRHLRARFGLSPRQYREKWGLPADYPMVAPDYSKKRSTLARDSKLGQKTRSREIDS